MNFRSISVAYLHFDSQVTGLNTQIAPRMHFENGHLSSHGGFIAKYVSRSSKNNYISTMSNLKFPFVMKKFLTV